MNQPEQVAFEKTYNLWQTSAPSANVKHAFREGHDMGWKNAIKHISRHGEAVSNYSQAELGEHYCHSVKTHDPDAKARCLSCQWQGERHALAAAKGELK